MQKSNNNRQHVRPIAISPLYCLLLWVIYLKYFLVFFNKFVFSILYSRNLCVQLFPFDSWLGKLNLLLNLILYLGIYIVVFGSPIYNGASAITFFKKEKPFLGLFFEMVVRKTFPLATIVSMFYYIFYGQRIIRLLDSPCLRRPYQGRAQQLFALLLLGNTLLVLSIHTGNIRSVLFLAESLGMSQFQVVYNIFFLYVSASAGAFHFVIIHYLMYATYQNLLQMNHRQKAEKLSKSQERVLISQFTELAVLNQQIWQLISFQMLVYYFTTAIQTMVLSYMLIFIFFFLPLAINAATNILYYIYMINYNWKIRRLAREIVSKLQADESKDRSSLATRRQLHRHKIQTEKSFRAESRLIRHLELEQYLEYFTIYIYNMTIMDRAFLFGTALLALNYAVFIYQT